MKVKMRNYLLLFLLVGFNSFNLQAQAPCTQILSICPQNPNSVDNPCSFVYYIVAIESTCFQCVANGQGTFEIVAGGGFNIQNDAGQSYIQNLAGTYIIPSNFVNYVGGSIPYIKIMFLNGNSNYIINWYPPNSSSGSGCPVPNLTRSYFTNCDCTQGGGGTGNNTSTCELDVFCKQASNGYCQNVPYNFRPKTPDCSGCMVCGPGTYEIVAGSTFTVGGVNYNAGTHTIPSWMVSGLDFGITVTFTDDFSPYIIKWTPPTCPANCPQAQQSYSLFTGCDQNACNGGGGTGGTNEPPCELVADYDFSGVFCGTNNFVDFNNQSIDLSDNIISFQWNFGDNTSDSQPFPSHSYSTPGDYLVTLIIENDHVPNACKDTIVKSITIDSICDLPCTSCIGSFSPTPNKKYVLSAWTQEKVTGITRPLTYTKPKISVVFTNSAGATSTAGPFLPKGQLIDEWQRIEEEFFIPQDAVNIQLKLESTSGDVYFDDIRVFPFDGSMKSFVYDPVTLRFVAELDERNYATFYEYNEEGSLVRTKKETEKGIMTIQESRSNIQK
jgi:hypothetical protein